VPLREEHRAHPLLTLGYQEVFDVLGGSRNLGVAANLFYSENGVGGFGTVREFQNTLNEPAYLWSYRVWDNYNNRKQKSLNVKADYRYSFNSKFTVSATLNSNLEKWRRLYEWRAYTGSATTVPNATTSGVIPGFTNRITQVRPVAASMLDSRTSGPNNYLVRTYQFAAGGEHTWGPLQLEYSADLAENDLWRGTGVGYLTSRVTNIGWILDRTESDLYPKFIQTAGPDITNPASYRPPTNGLTRTPEHNVQQVRHARADARYVLPVAAPVTLRAGLDWREQESALSNFSRRWSYAGTGPLPPNPAIALHNDRKTGLVIPQWEVAALMKDGEPADPALWREDRYYAEQIGYTGTRGATEAVVAAYFMGQGASRPRRLARPHRLAGRHASRGNGYRGLRLGAQPLRQHHGPAAGRPRRHRRARLRRQPPRLARPLRPELPSVHLTHDWNRNLKTRLSWSTSFGRPALTNLMPNESVNETNQTLTVNNPALLPQSSTNWDATLEYYFEPVGNFSVGWFHKEIRTTSSPASSPAWSKAGPTTATTANTRASRA
jgi:hypothetical protein